MRFSLYGNRPRFGKHIYEILQNIAIEGILIFIIIYFFIVFYCFICRLAVFLYVMFYIIQSIRRKTLQN